MTVPTSGPAFRIKRLPLCVATALGSLFVATPALSDTRAAVQELDTVVVTASGFEQEIKQAPASISVVTRDQLMREVWDTTWWSSTKTLDMHISWLRKKLGDDPAAPRLITTLRGVGFRFETG